MSEVDELLAAGVRPPSLGEPPGPAVRVGRRQQPGTIEQQSLDAPVLQTVDHLIDVVGYFGTLVPDVAEQVIDVPEISPQDGNLQRASLRRNWLNSWWKCQPFFFPSSRSSTNRLVLLAMEVFKIFFLNRVLLRLVEQIIVFPLQIVVRAVEVLKVYAQNRIQQRFSEQNMDLFTVYAQDRIQQRLGEQKMELFKVCAEGGAGPGGGPQDVVPVQGSGVRDDAWVMVTTPEQRTYYWHRRDGTTRWRLPTGVRHGWVRAFRVSRPR